MDSENLDEDTLSVMQYYVQPEANFWVQNSPQLEIPVSNFAQPALREG